MKIRFEEKAFIRQRFLEAKNKTMQMAWMLHGTTTLTSLPDISLNFFELGIQKAKKGD